eukprot:3941613-Rhodomonas_salina.2
MDQSINQWINRSINGSMDQSINGSMEQSVGGRAEPHHERMSVSGHPIVLALCFWLPSPPHRGVPDNACTPIHAQISKPKPKTGNLNPVNRVGRSKPRPKLAVGQQTTGGTASSDFGFEHSRCACMAPTSKRAEVPICDVAPVSGPWPEDLRQKMPSEMRRARQVTEADVGQTFLHASELAAVCGRGHCKSSSPSTHPKVALCCNAREDRT